MLDELRAMAVFGKAVETGSFRAAARALALSPSVVSHHIARLEARLGVALLYRSTRRLALTADGEKLFDAVRQMTSAAEGGLNQVALKSDEPAGRLTVAAPAALMSGPLLDDVADFARRFPRIQLALNFSDARLDMLRDGIDVAIRIGGLEDSSMKAKKLFEMPRTLVAAAEYAAARPRPRAPADLAGWDWIRLKSRPNHAELIGRGGRIQRVQFSPRIVVDSGHAALDLARHGLGLAMVPALMAEPHLARGRIVEVLPDWRLEAPAAYAVWPPNAPRNGLAMRFVSHLAERISQRRERRG